MKYLWQRMGTSPEGHALADGLMKLYQHEEWPSPAALKAQLQATIEHNQLALTIGQMNGVINIHGSAGIILRIRPMD